MELSGRVRILKDAGFGAWHVAASANDFRFLGKPLARASGRSIVGLQTYELSDDGEFLVFPINEARVLSLGDRKGCVAIAFRYDVLDTEPNNEEEEALSGTPVLASAATEHQKFRSGDHAFIAACEAEALPPEIVELGRDFLNRVREFSDDKLEEGKNRKWVTYPKNFLALTIQNRKQQFCIHVKKTSVLDPLNNTLDIRDDRPGYVRFWLKEKSQLEAAVKAAKGSFGT